MSYNIKTLALSLDANNWWLRRGPQAELIRRYGPDLIGMHNRGVRPLVYLVNNLLYCLQISGGEGRAGMGSHSRKSWETVTKR